MTKDAKTKIIEAENEAKEVIQNEKKDAEKLLDKAKKEGQDLKKKIISEAQSDKTAILNFAEDEAKKLILKATGMSDEEYKKNKAQMDKKLDKIAKEVSDFVSDVRGKIK